MTFAIGVSRLGVTVLRPKLFSIDALHLVRGDLEAPGSCRSARVRKHGGVHCLQQVACEQPCGALRGYPAHESALTHNLQACVATTPHLSLLGRTIPQHSVRSQLPPTSCCECLLTSCHVPLQIRPLHYESHCSLC